MDVIKHILLVEDDGMIASGLIYALEKESYRVTHCQNVGEACSTVQNEVFDLAILDMQLPDGTGFDVSKALDTRNTAIIF